ncbi:MAG TPA: hypothetical protein VME92_05920, partial [Acetobacteraceae bacterium]|nr:hypothetical protein [Acetobacteraceae bacterium]
GVPETTLRFEHADGELLVDCQSIAVGLSGAVACGCRIAVRSNSVISMMQIPPSHNVGEADPRRVVKSKHRGQWSLWILANPQFRIE